MYIEVRSSPLNLATARIAITIRSLRAKPGLIADGMYRFIRHPNMMIYGSFALMVWHRFLLVIRAWIWGGLFAVNMTLKDASMSRYPGWTEYKKRSWWLLPPVL
jgi:protein-S-isoprenylcysteine O-methyltransferase Ste14